MKIFVFDRINNEIQRQKEYSSFYLKPETSLLKGNMPFFFPDFSNDIRFNIGVVAKISKLGKSIKEKYASNYYHECSLCINLIAKDILHELVLKMFPWDKALTFDGSTIIGNFQPIQEFSLQINKSCKVNLNNKTQAEFDLGLSHLSFNKAIEEISKYYTLKIGDYLIIEVFECNTPIQIEDLISIFISDEKRIEFKIK